MKSILSNNKTHWRSKKFVNENNFVKEGIQSNYLEKIHSADVPRNGQKLNNDFRGSNTSQLAILLSLPWQKTVKQHPEQRYFKSIVMFLRSVW